MKNISLVYIRKFLRNWQRERSSESGAFLAVGQALIDRHLRLHAHSFVFLQRYIHEHLQRTYILIFTLCV